MTTDKDLEKFHAEISAICIKFGVYIDHEDTQGAFEIRDLPPGVADVSCGHNCTSITAAEVQALSTAAVETLLALKAVSRWDYKRVPMTEAVRKELNEAGIVNRIGCPARRELSADAIKWIEKNLSEDA